MSGLVLLGVLFLLSSRPLAGQAEVVIRDGVTGVSASRTANLVTEPKSGDLLELSTPQIKSLAGELRDAALHQLLTVSALALLVMTAFSTAVGWWIAGRVLRPLHTITSRARTLSWRNIHERIGMRGPPDELRELADTFDGMLERLDSAFSSQRRFIANASHELRTPLAIERAILQIRLGDPGQDELPAIRTELLALNRRTERLIDGLLTLARSDHGLVQRIPVDVALLAQTAVAELWQTPPAGAPPDVQLSVDAAPLSALGEEVLLGQLVTNLVQNAVQHNVAGGWVTVRTAGHAGLVVRNSGPVLDEEDVDGLFEPFRRGAERLGTDRGSGLGLSIVRFIVHAHRGTLDARPEPGGGLRVTVTLPAELPAGEPVRSPEPVRIAGTRRWWARNPV